MIEYTDEYINYTNEIVNLINEKLKEEKHFDGAYSKWYGYEYVEFILKVKDIKGYYSVQRDISFGELKDIGSATQMLVDTWNEKTSDEYISDYLSFIKLMDSYMD